MWKSWLIFADGTWAICSVFITGFWSVYRLLTSDKLCTDVKIYADLKHWRQDKLAWTKMSKTQLWKTSSKTLRNTICSLFKVSVYADYLKHFKHKQQGATMDKLQHESKMIPERTPIRFCVLGVRFKPLIPRRDLDSFPGQRWADAGCANNSSWPSTASVFTFALFRVTWRVIIWLDTYFASSGFSALRFQMFHLYPAKIRIKGSC